MQAVHRHACTCSHSTHAAYRPFAAESLGNGRHGCATRSLYFLSLYLLGPTDNADPPKCPQMRPFPPQREAENIHAVSHVLLSQFFVFCFFYLPKESSQVSTNQTQGWLNLTNSSQSMSSEAFWTPNTASSQFVANCQNQVREVKVRPIKNELSSPNFFPGSPNTRN